MSVGSFVRWIVCPLDRMFVVTEVLEGGELFDRIVSRNYYSELDAVKVRDCLYATPYTPLLIRHSLYAT
jgi:hypothetical protein